MAISTRNLSPPDTQTEESNGGGGGIETREEGEIGGRRRDTEAILSCHFCSHRRVIMSGTSKALLDLAEFVYPGEGSDLGLGHDGQEIRIVGL